MSETRGEALVAEVTRRIQQALEANAEDESANICVHLRNGTAVLTGTVHSWAQHEHAEAAARSTPGVSRVCNDLALEIKGKVSTR